MKRTTNAQIGGKVFSFEEDAYLHIVDYIKDAEKTLHGESDKDEIIQDLETAICARLTDRKATSEAVTLTEAVLIIDSMGKVESFNTDDVPKNKFNWRDLRYFRIARDSKSAVLGGVCSGMIINNGGDASATFLMRLAFVILTLITGGLFIFVYLFLWIFMPEDPLKSKNASATNIADQARLRRSEAKNALEKIAQTFEDTLKVFVKIIIMVVRTAIVSVASLLLAAVVFGFVAVIIWLSSSSTTDSLATVPVYLHAVSIAVALGVPLTVLIAMAVRAKSKLKMTFTNVITVVVPWMVAVIASISLIGVNQNKYNDYVRKVRPDNAFVSTVTLDDNVIIRCIGLDTCSRTPKFAPVYRCGVTYLTVSEYEAQDMIMYPSGLWEKHSANIVPPVTEESFCEQIKQLKVNNDAELVIVNTPFDAPSTMLPDSVGVMRSYWELTYFVRPSSYINSY